MFKAPAATESKRRPLAAIGSERAARLAGVRNQELGGQAMATPNNPQANTWPNSSTGGRVRSAIGSESAVRPEDLPYIHLTDDDLPDISFSVSPEWSGAASAGLPGWQAEPLTEERPPSGHSFFARLIENLDPDQPMAPRDNLNLRTPSPLRTESVDLEALRYVNVNDGLPVWPLNTSSSTLSHNDGDISFSEGPSYTHWSNMSGMLPDWETDPPTGSDHTFSIFQPEEFSTRHIKVEPQSERVPHPDSNPLPPPSPPTRTNGPDGYYLLLGNAPVQAEGSWLDMLPNCQVKQEPLSPKPEPMSEPEQEPEHEHEHEQKPELPLPPPNDDRVLEALHRVKAINHGLVERILSQMPDEHSRHRFHCELLRQQLASEQQLTGFLEEKLKRERSSWIYCFATAEDAAAALEGGLD